MLKNLLAIGALCASVISASPVTVKRDDFGLEWISKDSSLPKVVLYNTGGTIVSTSNYSTIDNVNYGSGPRVLPEYLIGNYSIILEKAQIAIVDMSKAGGSSNLNSTLYFNVSRAANEHLCSEGSDIDGAFFGVDLTLNCSKPFVATGAMRPESYISNDGPSNFYQAVAVAADPKARDRGALVVFNDRISSAFYTIKTNGNTPDTFKALEQGNLGAMLGGQPYWFFTPSYPVARYYFDLSSMESGEDLPHVVVLFGSQGFDTSLMYAAVANGAKGIIIMGAGAGQLSTAAATVAGELKAQGVPVVASLRPVTGASPPKPYEQTYISSGYMQAGKARIQLQLCLATGMGWEGCRDVFEKDMREVIYNDSTEYYFS
ncbi:hypothetical protein L486_08274 [Kwoniella mangroviensis CBS 10435]|uniref:asparaginase n=1 Tax=Kwoniella mangroviensis CBS 10435 TaxID=1331196 RepID=A0A1B9IGC0_9TREE|nr:hypothetical protein L486_08274 [Kwoniella mangroviensis CBS 10435]